MTTAERNRKLKSVLVAEFGQGNVTVRGDRGTAYGWVCVKIKVPPFVVPENEMPHWAKREHFSGLRSRVFDLMREHKITVGTYGYDHPGSDYGYGPKITMDFDELPVL
jgi:hypothetical protein